MILYKDAMHYYKSCCQEYRLTLTWKDLLALALGRKLVLHNKLGMEKLTVYRKEEHK